MLSDRLDILSPFQCRLVARNPGRTAKTVDEIVRDSGLSRRSIIRFSKLHSWSSMTVATIDAFMKGCGITFETQRAHLRYLKRSIATSRAKLAHVREKEKKHFAKVLLCQKNNETVNTTDQSSVSPASPNSVAYSSPTPRVSTMTRKPQPAQTVRRKYSKAGR